MAKKLCRDISKVCHDITQEKGKELYCDKATTKFSKAKLRTNKELCHDKVPTKIEDISVASMSRHSKTMS